MDYYLVVVVELFEKDLDRGNTDAISISGAKQ